MIIKCVEMYPNGVSVLACALDPGLRSLKNSVRWGFKSA